MGAFWRHNGHFLPPRETSPRVCFCAPQTSRTPESTIYKHSHVILGLVYDLCALEQMYLLPVCTG